MKLPLHKTKIICTIGPASSSPAMLEDLVKAGMNVARINCSHGDFEQHKTNIDNVNKVAAKLNQLVSIIMDLPGVKMRVGNLKNEPLVLKKGAQIVLTTNKGYSGDPRFIPVEFKKLVESVSVGSVIYLNDGFIQLKVVSKRGKDVLCRVVMGGDLLSHKGLNLPGAKLSVKAITKRDLEFVDFGLKHGVSTFGLSFVERASDIQIVREFAKARGKKVYLVAKIERREAIANFDEILKAADAVMIARGDLGVEIPIEEVPIIQKRLIQRANIMGRPVITATQMLESMTQNVRPTRAEVNDVANAILDGTDAIMLSEETAVGQYPIETVKMMVQIALMTERQRNMGGLSNDESEKVKALFGTAGLSITDVISLSVAKAAETLKARYILTPTASGNTARRISRFKPHCWILAYSFRKETWGFLAFSYGIYPFLIDEKNKNNPVGILKSLRDANLASKGDTVVMTERSLSDRPGDTDSLGIITLE